MNKAELAAAIAEKTGMTKVASENAVNAFMETVTETVADGESVQLIGFGTFSAVKRAARKGRNIQTGNMMKIKARTVPKFKAGQAFKDMM